MLPQSSNQNSMESTDKDPKVLQHARVCLMLNALYEKKNADYGDSFSKTFADWGPVCAGIRLEDKLNRFKSLVTSGDQKVSDESITDTLIDMANYAIMTYMELVKENPENN